jgi:hypothetical protein|tara:strand:- start:2266 stop:2583 length:318 start_codon:yes stop_codon:yes gene_type:complete
VVGNKFHPADTDGDGIVSDAERDIHLEARRKELEDADAMRDAQRNMAWHALWGMLLYPLSVVIADLLTLSEASKTLGSMAPTYFVSVAAIVAAFYAKEVIGSNRK